MIDTNEDRINALLSDATDAFNSALEARTWASPAYVAEKEEAALAVWEAYRAAQVEAEEAAQYVEVSL